MNKVSTRRNTLFHTGVPTPIRRTAAQGTGTSRYNGGLIVSSPEAPQTSLQWGTEEFVGGEPSPGPYCAERVTISVFGSLVSPELIYMHIYMHI